MLDALNAQTLPKGEWELLLIDNASKEPLAAAWDLSWHPRGRHIRDDEIGLTPARLRGIKESQSEILAFVADDNVLEASYAQKNIHKASLVVGTESKVSNSLPLLQTSTHPCESTI